MSKMYKFEIQTNNKECFKNSIIDFAELLKTEDIDLEAFATKTESAIQPQI